MFCIRHSSVRLRTLSEKLYNNYPVKNSYKCLTNGVIEKKHFFIKNYSSQAGDENEENEIDISAITDGNKELEHKLKVLMLEAEVMRQEGRLVPPQSFFTTEHWKETLKLETRSARRKYFEFLFKLSRTKENRLAKKLQKQQEREEFLKNKDEDEDKCETVEDHAMRYDLKHNNIFLRFYDSTINQMYNNRLVQAMQFSQKVVIDCGYDENMTNRENMNCAKQLMLVFAENRFHDQPLDLHYCNANNESLLIQKLRKFIPTLDDPEFPFNLHTNSYLDLFPKEKLVYLTPHCREELLEYDHDAVYIIGAIVDKINNEPLSLAKAKREGIRMAKFPLDRYLQWGSGSGKSLTLNQCVAILLDIGATGDWNYALRHVPRRKIADFNMGENIRSASNKLRYDRPKTERKWVPSANIDLDKLRFSNKNDITTNRSKERERLVKLKSVFD